MASLMLRQAVIVVGSGGSGADGTAPITAMVRIGDAPLLELLVRHLACFGLREIVMATDAPGDVIADHFGSGTGWGVRINYARQLGSAGSGGILKLLNSQLDEHFVLLDANLLFDVNYLDLENLRHEASSWCAMALRHAAAGGENGGVGPAGKRATAFSEQDTAADGVRDGGVYVLARRAVDYVTGIPCSFKGDVLPRMIADGRVVARRYDGYFVDIGAPGGLEELRRTLPGWWRKPIAFLDRDGVINRDKGYVSSPEGFEWVAGAPEAIRLLNDRGYRVVVVTNQSGIARGYYDEAAFHGLMAWVADGLQCYGAHIDAVYFCPHHPSAGSGDLRRDCDCRKPKPGMITRALREFSADPGRCFLVGDKPGDLQAATAAGVTGYLFEETANLAEFIGRLLEERAGSRALL